MASSRGQSDPPYSQALLAEALSSLGYPATTTRIAELERSDPHRHPVELLTAIAIALRIDQEAVYRAVLEDARTVGADVRARLGDNL